MSVQKRGSLEHQLQVRILSEDAGGKSATGAKNRKKPGANTNTALSNTLQPNYDDFIEDYFSMILSQFLSLKLQPGKRATSFSAHSVRPA